MGYIKSSDLACEHSIWERQSLFIALLGLFPFEFYFKCYCSSHVLFAGKISKCLTAGGAPRHSEPARPLKKYLKTIIVTFCGFDLFFVVCFTIRHWTGNRSRDRCHSWLLVRWCHNNRRFCARRWSYRHGDQCGRIWSHFQDRRGFDYILLVRKSWKNNYFDR